MTITKKDLYRKAKGIIDSIDRMRDLERRGSPSQAFGEDYNKLRSATRALLPDLEPLLPP